MKAVILAAGEGIRLRPITFTRPKHMIKIGGKPLLEHNLDILKKIGVEEVIIVIHYMGDLIRRFFGDGEKLGIEISYAEQQEMLGTGNAVSTTEPYMQEDFILVYGDLLFTPEALKNVMNIHKKKCPTATIAAVPVDNQQNYGILELGDGKILKGIVEKPNLDETPSNLANAGLYVFSTEIFKSIRQTKATVRGEWEITDAISLMIEDQKTVAVAEISQDDWMDVGRPWDLLEANKWILSRIEPRVVGLIENGANLIGPVTIEEKARIRSGAYIEGPVFVGAGSDIGPNCYLRPCTSIGENVRIGNACEIKSSIIMDMTHIGHLSYVGDSILGEKCNLGAGTKIANYRFDGTAVKMIVKDQLIDTGRIKLGAILGDNVKTGINSLLMPGVKVGNNTWIGPSFTVKRDLPENSLCFS